MSERWERIAFSDCLDKSPKASKIPKKKFKNRGQYPIISQEKDLINGYWNDLDDVIRVDQPVVVFGDHTQAVKLIDFDFVVGADGVKILKPKKFLDPRYFYYFLIGHPVKALGYARHFRLLKELEVAIPPLAEQKRIVAILDEAFAGIETAIANTERNLASAQELFESHLNTVFDARRPNWQETTLGELYRIGSSKRVHRKDWRERGVPFYRAREIVKLAENGEVDNELFISEELFEEYGEKTGVPQDGDLMVTAVGTLGFCYVVQPADRFYFKDASVLWFRPKASVNAKFIQYAFRSPVVKRQTTDSQGATVGTLTISRANSISITVPELEMQDEIARSLKEIESGILELRAVQQRKLDALRELKLSLLQKAFSGELTAGRAERETME